MEILQTIAAFLLALGVLVAFHEYGHYWVARRLGVKILRFSLGFGRPLWIRRFGPDETEFALSVVPLGGYVKMLDEREGEVLPHECHRAFNRQSVLVRAAIVSAGPLANFLLALLVYWGSFMVGVAGPRPFVGVVAPQGMAALAGLRGGDEILAVNGEPTAIWDNVLNHAIDAILDSRTLSLEVRGKDAIARQITLNFAGLSIDDVSHGDFFGKAGFQPLRVEIPAIIGKLKPDEPAAKAGFLVGDTIIEADGQPVSGWMIWVEYVRARPGKLVHATVRRAGQRVVLEVTPRNTSEEGRLVGRIGAEVAPPPASSAPLMAIERYTPIAAAVRAGARTYEVTTTTLKFLRQMVIGQASVQNLSGPLSIAQFAGESAKLGVSRFLEFLGLVSVSLGVLNLLPVPMLDGGHLIYYLIESVLRRPIPESIQVAGQQLGMGLLLGLMGLAMYNDLMHFMRYF